MSLTAPLCRRTRNLPLAAPKPVVLSAIILLAVVSSAAVGVCTAQESAAADAGLTVRVQTLDGSASEGPVTSWTDEAIELEGDDPLPLSAVMRVDIRGVDGAARQITAFSEVPQAITLADGTALVIKSAARTDGMFRARPASSLSRVDSPDEPLSFPDASVRTVRYASATPTVWSAWSELADSEVSGDLFVVLRGGKPDRVNCTIGQVTESTVSLRARGRDLSVPTDKVFGLIFGDVGATKTAPVFVTLSDGSRVGCDRVAVADDALTLSRSAEVWRVAFADVAAVDLASGRLRPLSDLEPTRVTYQPFGENYNEFVWKLRRDRNFDRRRLRVGGREYDRGLWIHSGTTAAFRLPAGASRLEAMAGIDETETEGRPVKLTILADGRPVFEETVRPDEPRSISVEVGGRRELTLKVETLDPSWLGIREHLAVVGGRLILE